MNVVPISKTAADSVDRLRHWASGRCLSADRPGVFQYATPKPARRRRSVASDPASN
jgi:hypothetical protein